MAEMLSNAMKVYKLGEHGSKTKGNVQEFHKLREELLKNKELFVDPEFPPPTVSSPLARSAGGLANKPADKPADTSEDKPNANSFKWRRASEISAKPQFSTEGFNRFDVKQGLLGNCWMVAGMDCLPLNRRLFRQVVPYDQGFGNDYAGIFYFRIWRFGRWIEVVIDDMLPVGEEGQLIYTHSGDPNEFWSALLEKAFAKLEGSYEALRTGKIATMLVDLTGGIVEDYYMREKCPPNLFQIILRALERNSLVAAGIWGEVDDPKSGLLGHHGYTITRARYVKVQKSKTPGMIALVRVRNPWGQHEWTGAWSDDSPEWNSVTETEKVNLGLTCDEDGEYWMAFDDFKTLFNQTTICNLNPDSLSKEKIAVEKDKMWVMSMFEGEWVKGVTAGGGNSNPELFYRNPQYRITLTEYDPDDEEKRCTLVVALLQKYRRRDFHNLLLNLTGYIYYLRDPNAYPTPIDISFFEDGNNIPVAQMEPRDKEREIVVRLKLQPGSYCIIPCTTEPDQEAEYLLRVYAEHKFDMRTIDQHVGYCDIDKRAMMSFARSAVGPEDDEKAKEMFSELAGWDGEIDWMDLKKILDSCAEKGVKDQGISKETCQSMISMLDHDRVGTLNLQEFNILWNSLRVWKKVFKLYDAKNLGILDKFGLRQAMNSAGYTVSNHILKILMQRYGNAADEINLEAFILCVIKMKTVIDFFSERDTKRTNTATLTLEEWLEHTASG